MLSRPQTILVAHALALIAILLWLVPYLTSTYGTNGYLLSFVFYWLAFCVPVTLIHVLPHRGPRLFSEKLERRDWFVPLLVLAQAALIAVAALAPTTALLTTQGAMLALVFAVINGPLEEIAWRGGFMTRFADKPRLGFWLGWLLFTAWHIPLALSHGVIFDGGGVGLVASAALLGLFWNWLAWRTGSVFWVGLAHALTNLTAFWALFERSGFI
jgi:membrane protease YdiL (CAAX protease family)